MVYIIFTFVTYINILKIVMSDLKKIGTMLVLGSQAVQADSIYVKSDGEFVTIESVTGQVRWNFNLRKDTVDGVSFDSVSELVEAVAALTVVEPPVEEPPVE